MPNSFLFAKRFGTGRWWFIIGPGSEKSGILSVKIAHKEWDKNGWANAVGIRRKRTSNFPCYKPIVQRSAEKQGTWKIVDTLLCRFGNDWNFRKIISVNQLSLYGLVAEMCEEYETLHDRTVRTVVRGRSSSSFVPSVIKTEMLLDCDDIVRKDLLLQQCENELKSYHNETNWANFVWMRDFGVLLRMDSISWRKTLEKFRAMACREYTQPRDEGAPQPKGWIQGNTKIGPVLEVATCYLHGKYGVEIRIMSLNRQFSLRGRNFSWLEQIGHEFEQRRAGNLTSAVRRICVEIWMRVILHADQRPMQNHKDENLPALSQQPYLFGKEFGSMLNQSDFSVEEINSSSLSWKTTSRKWWSNWILENQRQSPRTFLVLSSLVWRQVEENHGKRRRKKEIFQYCTDSSGAILYLRALQGHDPTLQDNVIPIEFFQYVYHFGCAVNLHSIINSGFTPGGQNLRNRQTVFFLLVFPMDKHNKDPDTIDLNEPRHAQRVMHKTCLKHGRDIRTQCIGSTSILSSIRLDRTQSFFTKQFQLVVFRKLLGWKLVKSYTRKYLRHLGLLRRS